MLRVQRVLAGGTTTEGAVAFVDRDGVARTYEDIKAELEVVFGQRVDLRLLEDSVLVDLYPSTWAALVEPGATINVAAAVDLCPVLSGRTTPGWSPTPTRRKTGYCGLVDAISSVQSLGGLEGVTSVPPVRSSAASGSDRAWL